MATSAPVFTDGVFPRLAPATLLSEVVADPYCRPSLSRWRDSDESAHDGLVRMKSNLSVLPPWQARRGYSSLMQSSTD